MEQNFQTLGLSDALVAGLAKHPHWRDLWSPAPP